MSLPKCFFVDGLESEKKDGRQSAARLRFLWRLEVSAKRQVLDIYLKAWQIARAQLKNELSAMR